MVLATYDEKPAVHFLKNGDFLKSVDTPSIITCMSSGRVTKESLSDANRQIILGSVNGAVYLLENLVISKNNFYLHSLFVIYRPLHILTLVTTLKQFKLSKDTILNLISFYAAVIFVH